MSESRMAECPPDRVWDELATGLLTGAQAHSYLEHASWCKPCAARLREAIDVFQPEETASELPVSIQPAAAPRRPWALPKVWGLAAGIVVAAGLGYYAWIARDANDPLVQLAVAYSKERTFELRIPGAAFARFDAPRSGGVTLANRPAEWIAVASRVQLQLARQPRDPLWLHAQGRLALLDNRPDDALTALKLARDFSPTGAAKIPDEITIDLATAYYQRGIARGDAGASDLTLAQDLLGPVIQRSSSTAARFNRALIEIELHQLPAAITDLEFVVSHESDQGWKGEAQRRLEQARARLRGFLERNPQQDEARYAELLLDRLLQEPVAQPPGADWQQLAVRFQREHLDPWVDELLTLPHTPAHHAAFEQLARLASIRVTAQRGRYLAERAEIAPLERASLPPPLAAWRDFELAYRSTHSGATFGCQVANVHPRYRWLRSQAKREAAGCAQADFANHLQLYREALTIALEARLPIAAARAEAIIGTVTFLAGNYRDVLTLQRRLLGRMIEERLPVARSHEPVHSMMLATRALGRNYAARSAAAMATAIARSSGLRNAEFTDLANEAELALKSGDHSATATAYEEAIRLFEQSKGSAALPSARAWVEIIMAEASGSPQRLAPHHSFLSSTADLYARVPYLRVRSLWDPTDQALQQLNQVHLLLASTPDTRRPGFLRQEAMLAAHQHISLLLAKGRIEDSFRLTQDLLAWNEAGTNLPRAALGSPTLFSLRTVGPRVIVWRKDQQGIHWRDGGAAATVEQNIRRLRRFASSPQTPTHEIVRCAGELTSLLFGSWLQQLPTESRILFQAEGILQAIPFPLLRGKEMELAREHSIAVTTTPTSAEKAPRASALPRTALLVDATRVPGLSERGFRPLPPPEEEWKAIRAYAARIDRITGAAVTADRLAAASAPVSLLHFAGHAEATSLGAGLVLASGQLSRFSQPVPARVVLSACSTARLEQEEEDATGLYSLASAFLAAGAAEVVAADWDMESHAAGLLMREFYTELAKHDDVGLALFTGIRRLAARPEFAHPYYWAGVRWLVRA
jgi:CHAT domain-containing protein